MNKICNVCGEEKDITEFYKNISFRDGYEGKCKKCRKNYQVAWREKNREKHRTYSNLYQKNNREARRVYFRKWVRTNLEHKRRYDYEWKHKNPIRLQAQRRADFAKRRALIENNGGTFTANQWLELKTKYNNTCLACGKKEPEVKITPDHVIPLALGGRNDIENIQPLCWGCNAAKQARYVDYRI